MSIDYAKEMLDFIGRKPDGVTLYQIARSFSYPTAPYDVRAVLENLLIDGQVTMSPPDWVMSSRFKIARKADD